jgi:PAS domain S-box-containing protein
MAHSRFLSLGQNVINAVFENSMDSILITGPDGSIFAANPVACKMFGRSEEEIISLGRNGLVDLTDKRLPALLNERLKIGRAKGELTFIREGGLPFVGEVSSEIFKDENAVSMTIMTIRDITDRKQKEEEVNFRSEIISNMKEGIQLTRESDASIIYTNPRFDKMFGYQPGELIGRNVAILNAPSDKQPEEMARDILSNLRKTGSWQGEILNIRKSGEQFWCSVTVTGFTHSRYGNLWISIHQDITDRRNIEDALKKSGAYNRSLIEASLDPLVTIGPDGKILDVNKATLEATGYSREKLIGTDFSAYFTEPERARAGYKKVFSAGYVRDYSLEIKHRNGRITPILYNATLFRDDEGNINGVFAAARDITKLKKAEKKFRQSSDELRQLTRHLVEAREAEKKIIAHDLHDDLGQKLTVLNLDISWLKSRIGVQSRAVEMKLRGMSSLINETIESIKSISYGLRPSILDDLGLQAAIDWQLSDLKKTSGISYEMTFIPEIIEVDSSISLAVFRIIQEALTNITRHSQASEVSILLSLKSKLKLVIRDNGIGIDSRKLQASGSFGIRGIIERARAFGGEAKIKGSKGKGTQITVVIPVRKTIE